ncbi:MAG: GtrA family protein [Asgard group archaeon]|nr:GtrA family protein [Asgard group archaeon]
MVNEDKEKRTEVRQEEKTVFINQARQIRFLKSVVVSGIGLGFYYLFAFLSRLVLDRIFSFNPLFTIWFLDVRKELVAASISIVIVMVYNYLANKMWTFKEQEKEAEFNTTVQFIKFALVGASGTLINLGLVELTNGVFDWNYYLALTIGFVVSVLTNFILNDIWTFNPKFGKLKKVEND